VRRGASAEDRRTRRRGALADINVTPLVDVLLVLLIIFMVVAPVAPRDLGASLPRESAAGGASAALVLEIAPGGLALNRVPVAGLDELDARLRDAFAARGDRTLFVRATGGLPYRTVVEALDVARGAGADRIGIMGSTSATQ
jgi:biopolymer transport protein ExbD